jgi:hypothetical protein
MATLGLRVGESVDFPLRGSCMPALAGVTRVQVLRQRTYLPGDVVVVRRRDHWNVHRFLGYAPSTRGWVALTQADDCVDADPAAPARCVTGRVACRVRIADRALALRRYAGALWKRARRVAR